MDAQRGQVVEACLPHSYHKSRCRRMTALSDRDGSRSGFRRAGLDASLAGAWGDIQPALDNETERNVMQTQALYYGRSIKPLA
jgi:hypothetical protein